MPVKTTPNSPAGTWSPIVDEYDVRSAEAALQWGLEFIELTDFVPSPELLAKFPAPVLFRHAVLHWSSKAIEYALRSAIRGTLAS